MPPGRVGDKKDGPPEIGDEDRYAKGDGALRFASLGAAKLLLGWAYICDDVIPGRPPPTGRNRLVYECSAKIAELKCVCSTARHRFLCVGRRGRPREAERAEFTAARKAFCSEIRYSQEKAWQELCELVNADPWGYPTG